MIPLCSSFRPRVGGFLAACTLLAAACTDESPGKTSGGESTSEPANVADDSGQPPDASPTVDAGDPGSAAAAMQQCLFENCRAEIESCFGDPECGGWLSCNQACDPNDKLLCPTICGWYYQSPLIAPFAQCMFDHECVVQDYSNFPACDAPEVEPKDLSGLGGTWWLTRHVSEDHALASDCQKLEWEELSSTALKVVGTAPLTLNGQERICRLEGTYQMNADGTIRTEYTTSYVDYFVKWTLIHKSANSFLVNICFSTPGAEMRKYGTWLITRTTVEDLSPQEYAELDAAATDALGYGIGDMDRVSMANCPNE